MFKAASQNSQIRERNIALNDRKNTSIDEAAWKDGKNQNSDARLTLGEEKRKIELRLADLKNCIGQFLIRNTHKWGGERERQQFERWSNERAHLVKKMKDIDGKLSGLRRANQELDGQRKRDLPERFMKMAKLMLADEIFKRILVASIHTDETEK